MGLGLSLARRSPLAISPAIGLASAGIVGFPLRIRAFDGVDSINLYRTSQDGEAVGYNSDDGLVYAYWDLLQNYGEFFLNGGDIVISGPTLASVPTSWPSTGWGEGWQFGVANPTLVTLSYASPQSFSYSNSAPSPAFTSSPAINANLFTISGLSSANVGTQNAVISLGSADYYLASSVTIPVTITKKNVTLSVNNQYSTYSPNGTYNWLNAVSVSTLAAGDAIQGGFNSNLLTGVPAAGANAGYYTISFNQNYTSANYNITNSPASATWAIGKANQTISFNPTGTAITTDSTNLSASSTSGLAVSFSVVSGPATLNGSTLTYSGAGSVVVRASQAGNTNYNAASNVDRTITVSAPQAGGGGISTSTQTIYLGGFITDGFLDLTNPVPLFRQPAGYPVWVLTNGHPSNPINAHISVSYVANQNGWYINLQNGGGEDGFYYTAASNSAGPSPIPTTGWVLESATGTITITAAPSGIPVASTESVLITTSTFSYTFLKLPEQESYFFDLNCVEEQGCEVNLKLEYPNRFGNGLPWRLYDYQNSLLVSTNASTNPTTIPTTGWSPSLTITAA